MKIKQIVDKLCNHEISKVEAVDFLAEIIDSFRNKNAIGFFVEQVAFSSENNDAVLSLRAPYSYNKIKGKVEIGDRVDVVILP